jgi:SAM-dependent methyltransferase
VTTFSKQPATWDEHETPTDESVNVELLLRIREALAKGEPVADADFDGVYPREIRAVSSQFWTPCAIARRAAELLVVDRSTHVLDVGSGVGKLCIVGAAATGARFTGIEHREALVQVARRAAETYGVAGARFIAAPMQEIAWTPFDAFYLFNPFAENSFEVGEHLDTTVELSRARFFRDIAFVEEMLTRAPVGARVLTYHGFGGAMPNTFEPVLRERIGTDALELWLKTRAFTFSTPVAANDG